MGLFETQTIKMKFFILALTLVSVANGEYWTGDGVMKCYGDMNIIDDRPFNEVAGTAQCKPEVWNGVTDPQAVFITGNDGTQFDILFVREEINADCVGNIAYTHGNLGDLHYCSAKSKKSMK